MISEGKRLFRDIFLLTYGITGLDIITLVTISLSIGAILIVIIIGAWLNKVTAKHHSQSDAIEVAALVSEFSQRLKRLEEGLVDQKVKQEILELRLERNRHVTGVAEREPDDIQSATPVMNPTEARQSLSRRRAFSAQKPPQNRLGNTERDVLRIVMEGGGRLTAREIQQRIAKTREHTARMLNSLFRDGLVERDVGVRPYSYSITDQGRNVVES